MLRRTIISRKSPQFLVLAVFFFLTTSCFTIVTKPQEPESRSNSLLPGLSLVDSARGRNGNQVGLPTDAPITEAFALTLSIEPANGGAVIVTPMSDSVADLLTHRVTGMSGVEGRPMTDVVLVRQYPQDMQLKLEAVPEIGYWFSGWSKGCMSVNLNVCVLWVSEDAHASATFLRLPSNSYRGKE